MISSGIHDLENNHKKFTNYLTLAVPAINIVNPSFNQTTHKREAVVLRFKFIKVTLHENW